MPNPKKLNDIPLLGAVTSFGFGLMGDALDKAKEVGGGAMDMASVNRLTTEEIRQIYDTLDTDKNGKLDKQEIADALRKTNNFSEQDIDGIIQRYVMMRNVYAQTAEA